MNNPSVFILGAQKCGTTTVADLLAEQPEVFVPSIKETYFFCDESLFARGRNWYVNEFYNPKAVGSATICCDATPFYLVSSEALERIASVSDDRSRYIVCLRDPVSRAYSAYWHQKRLGNEMLSFEDAIKNEPSRVGDSKVNLGRWWRHAYVSVGHYRTQLEMAFSLLGREKFLVLTEADLQDASGLQNTLRDFLGLPHSNVEPTAERANSASVPRSALLQSMVVRPSALKAMISKVVPREIRSAMGHRIRKANLKPHTYPPMLDETRAMLHSAYASDREYVGGLGVRLPDSWFLHGN
jgi:Sulfotransferase domain